MDKLLTHVSKYVDALESRCSTMVQDDVKFAVLGDSDGDACLFNGLLSSVYGPESDNWPVRAVLASQGSNGMFYRSPRRRATDNAGYDSYFSRDMSKGVLLAATQGEFPREPWDRWITYIDKSRPCAVRKPWNKKECLIRSLIYRYAPDDRSDITPACWAMMGRVATYRDWGLHSQMTSFEKTDGDMSLLEAGECEVGYQLHLKAVDAFIKLLVHQSREYSQKVGEICYRRVPDNLFYEFLAKREISESLIERYLDIAPSPSANFGNAWVWEKSSVAGHISKTCGWDFVFLGKVILYFA